MEQNRNMQYWSTFAVALTAMTGSVSVSWATPVIPKFDNNETNIILTETDISWMVSAISPGMMISLLGSGYSADRFGRRATLLGSAIPFILGTLFVLNATKAWMLWVARFCWGLSAGIIQSVAVIYITEIASKEIRGSLGVVNRFMFTFGAFLVVTVGSMMSYQTLSYMLIVLPVGYFIAILWIPETPYFLLKEGKVDAARKSLMKLNGYKDEKVLDENLEQMRSHVREEMKRSGTIKELFSGKQYRKAIIISVGLRTTQTLSGLIAIQQYLGRILQDTSLQISVSSGIILFGAVRFIISILASFMVDKVGRRPLLIYSYIGSSLILMSLGTFYFFDEFMHKTPDYLGYLTLFGLILLTIVSTLGFDTINFFIPPEIFPLNVKSSAMTALNIFIAIVTFIMVRGYQLVKDFSGLYGVFWFFGSFALIGAIFSYVAVPETKGKSLKEIQSHLQGDLSDDACEKLNKICENVVEAKEMNGLQKSNELARLKS